MNVDEKLWNDYFTIGNTKLLYHQPIIQIHSFVEIGLSGNFNGDPSDDFRLIGTMQNAGSVTEFGNQFQTSTKKE